MYFNPITRELFFDNGKLFKKLTCPFDTISIIQDIDSKNNCLRCRKTLINISDFSEIDLQKDKSIDSETCVKIDLLNTKIKIVRK